MRARANERTANPPASTTAPGTVAPITRKPPKIPTIAASAPHHGISPARQAATAATGSAKIKPNAPVDASAMRAHMPSIRSLTRTAPSAPNVCPIAES